MQTLGSSDALTLAQEGSHLSRTDSEASLSRHAQRGLPRYFKSLIIDEFLSDDLHAALLRHALTSEASFLPSAVSNDRHPEGQIDSDFRRSWRCSTGLGKLKSAFRDVIASKLMPKVECLGIPPFAPSGLEIELVAHRNGSFLRRHIDTATQSARDSLTSDRIVTGVYYFHESPKQFSGGELALAPLGLGEPKLVEPRDNRLVAFASFVPHEVMPVVCPVDTFAHARFAVNIWVHRDKRSQA